MTRKDQQRIIRELSTTIRKRMLENVHKLPAEWDGIELRQWLADIVNDDINYRKMERRRMQDYQGERLGRNL